MKNRSLLFGGILFLPLLTACVSSTLWERRQAPLTQYVDPRIGTGLHGHVFVGANVPFGLVQLGPTSIPQEWDWTSGYHNSDSTVIGFPHTHLSGTGIGDLHDITLMPVTGKVNYARGSEKDPDSGLWSYADRKREICRPGYYATHLLRYHISVELTCTERVGFHKYTFPETEEGGIVIDLENGGGWDRANEGCIRRTGPRTIEGYRYSSGWARDQRIYFAAEFSDSIPRLDVIADGRVSTDSLKGKKVYAHAYLSPQKGQPVYVKVALSPTSTENARRNLQAELPGWDFKGTVRQAREKWEKALSKIKIETDDLKSRRIFYTSLYHTMVAPSLFCDTNGDYYGADGRIHRGNPTDIYTTLSCWDTYRAAHPLMSLIHPERMEGILHTFLQIFKEQGKLPVWHLMGNETNCMVGNPGACIVADGLTKGYIADEEDAYNALKTSVMLPERGMQHRDKWGYIPFDLMKESVATDMEYAIADWAVAQAAQRLGKTDDHAFFLHRSRSYRHLFDPSTHFVRGRDTLGNFHEPFNPFSSDHRNDDYCEGNAWQYSFLAPHDPEGLAACFGGSNAMAQKLDSLFSAPSTLEGESSPDISGLIGQYAHGNEPSHHISYLYTFAGQPWKTAERVRQILQQLYDDTPDGLCGNEDVGAMSAWYILSALGLYQVEPAGGRYVFGSPIVREARLKVRDGIFTIKTHDNSAENRYIQEVRLNGKPHPFFWIDFEAIARGGTLEFFMGNQPHNWFRKP